MRDLNQLLSNTVDMKYDEIIALLKMGHPLYWVNHNFKLFLSNDELFKQNAATGEIKPLDSFESCDCFYFKD